MSRKPISNDRRNWLAQQLELWRESGIVDGQQTQRILGLYETEADNRKRQRNWFLIALVSIGVFLIGLAALLLVGYNWQALPAAVKVAMIFAAIAAAHGGGMYLRYVRQSPRLSEAAIFLGCLLYGAGIFLIGQIFNLNAHYPDGVWWWIAGVLPLALLLESLALHALLAALLAIWAGMEVLGFSHLGWSILWWRWGAVPNGAYWVLPIAAAGLAWCYRRNAFWAAALYVPLLAWWVVLQPFAWRFPFNPIFFIGAAGALLLMAAEAHPPAHSFARLYRGYGVLLFGGVLCVLSFFDFNTMTIRHGEPLAGLVIAGAIATLAVWVFAIAEGVKYHFAASGEADLAARAAEALRRQWLPLAMIAAMGLLSLWNVPFMQDSRGSDRLEWAALMPTGVANLAMIALAIWLMHVGLRDDRGLPFAAGVVYFLLWAVLRYVDLFGEAGGLLGASLMFFLCGGALLAVTLYWRRRGDAEEAKSPAHESSVTK